jgi:putative transposase
VATLKRNSSAKNIYSDNRTFFLTSECWQRHQLFKIEARALLLIDVMLHYRDERRFDLHDFTVMPEHFHALLTLDHTMSIEKAAQFIKGGFSHRVKKELNCNLEVWQTGYSENRVLSPEAYVNHRTYIYQNAVKRRLVEKAEDYPYCSANGTWSLDPNPFLLGG